MMNELKAAFIIAGGASQAHNKMIQKNNQTNGVQQTHDELLVLILIPFPFQDGDRVEIRRLIAGNVRPLGELARIVRYGEPDEGSHRGA